MPDVGSSRPIRTVLIQPYLPEYRIPVYRLLAAEPDIDLTVVHASTPWIKNVPADGFRAVFEPMRIMHLGRHPTYWQPSFTRWADPDLCDAMILNWDVHYLHLVPAIRKCRRAGIGTVCWGHGYSKNRGLLARPRQLVGALADAMAFYNERGRDELIDAGVERSRLFVAYNSLDIAPVDEAIARWKAAPDEFAERLRSHGITPGEPYVLFVARINPDRRLDLLLQAMRSLLPGRSMRAVIVGGGSEADVAELRSLAGRLGLADKLVLTGPIYREADLAPLFLGARAFVFPSYIGLSLNHAFAYGLPVLTSDAVDAHGPEFHALVPEQNGLTFHAGDVADLARKIARLLDEPALASRLGVGARRTIDEQYNIRRMVDGLANAVRFARARALSQQ